MVRQQKHRSVTKRLDLSSYEEEAIPFDAVIRKLAGVKAAHKAPARKPKKRSK